MKTLVIVIDGANKEDITVVNGKPLDCEMNGMIHTSSSCYSILTGEVATKENVMLFRQGLLQKETLKDKIQGSTLFIDVPLLSGKIYKEENEIPVYEVITDMTDMQKSKLMQQMEGVDFAMIWFYAIDKAFHAYTNDPISFNEVVKHMNRAIDKILSKVEYENVLILSDHGHQALPNLDHDKYGFWWSNKDLKLENISQVHDVILGLEV